MTNLASTPMNTADDTPLLRVKDLRTWFRLDGHEYHAVDGVSFDIRAGEVLGLVGESGCGKSVTSLSIMRLIPSPPGFIKSGEIDFCGTNLLSFSAKEMRKIRGDKISMIFQEPMTALNPLLTLGTQVAEVLQIHRGMKKQDAIAKTIELFERVRIPDAAKQVSCYPHQISGGMRQRVMIAMALACRPSLLIADEPTTALDVTVQAQILALLEELRGEFGSSILLITHDLGVVAQACDRVVVMYAGQVVESASVYDLFEQPRHPYTHGLMLSIPRLEKGAAEAKPLNCIQGSVPEPDKHPNGCRFHPRCPYARDICHEEMPELRVVGTSHCARCHFAEDIKLSKVKDAIQ